MLFKSALLTQASGSVGGIVASHNRGGMYFRARTIPVNPNSPAQQVVRGATQALSTAWQDVLTGAQRDTWKTYGDNVAMTNKLGDQVFLTGQQHYIRSNVPRLVAGLTRIDPGPVIFNLGTFTDPVLTAAGGAGTLSIAFTDADAWTGEDNSAMIIQQSREQAPSINFFKGPFRFNDSIDGDTAIPVTTPQVLTTLFAMTLDNLMFVRARVTRSDGRLSSAVIIQDVIGG